MRHETFEALRGLENEAPTMRIVRREQRSVFSGKRTRWVLEGIEMRDGVPHRVERRTEADEALEALRRSLVQASGEPNVDPAEAVPENDLVARATVGVGTAIAGAVFLPAGVALAVANTLGRPNLKLTAQVIALSGTFLGISSF